MQSVRFRQKLRLLSLLPLSIFALLLFLTWNFITLTDGVEHALDRERQLHRATLLASQAIQAQLETETAIRALLVTHDAAFADKYHAESNGLEATLNQLEKTLRALRLQRALIASEQAAAAHDSGKRLVASKGFLKPSASIRQIANGLPGERIVKEFRTDMRVVMEALPLSIQRDRQVVIGDIQRLFGVDIVSLLAIAATLTLAWVRDVRSMRTHASIEQAYEIERNAAKVNACLVSRLQQLYTQQDLPVRDGLSFSAWYQAAGEDLNVGGDWYKAVALDDDRILFGIGDVTGHGIEAALIMGKIRRHILTSAIVEDDPRQILQHLNSAMFSEGHVATALLGIVSISLGRVMYAVAGHCQPIVVTSDGRARLLATDGLPLGVQEAVTFRLFSETLESRSRLILYTDGLLEFNRAPIEAERTLLEAAASISHYNGADFSERLARMVLGDASPRDDIAVLSLAMLPNAVNASQYAIAGLRMTAPPKTQPQ